MSGIYIKGMEMPKNCYICMFFRNETEFDKDDRANILFRCVRTGEESWDYKGGYLPNCPLIPVPDHGDLIDRDTALNSLMNGMVMTGHQSRAMDCLNEIYVPTIIEADKENGE